MSNKMPCTIEHRFEMWEESEPGNDATTFYIYTRGRQGRSSDRHVRL